MKPDGYNPSNSYDVSVDGQRFLTISASDDTSASGITVAVNWTAGPKQ